MKTNQMQPISESLLDNADFIAIFGKQREDRQKIQVAEVQISEERAWWHLIAKNHDVIEWEIPSELCRF